MPKNPLDYLTTPLVAKSTIRPYQDMIDAPELDRGPIEAGLRGFGAGALEGVRSQTSPADILGLLLTGSAAKGLLTAKKGVSAARGALSRMPPQQPPRLPPEFTPVGGEGAYNAGMRGVESNPLDSFYRTMLERLGGRGRP